MAGRVDLKYYNNGCRRSRNFILTPQGPARRRPGTRFVAEIKASANRSWLGRFEFNVEQAYVLEFGNTYIRFFADHGVVGAPFEVTTPYTTADLTNDDGTFALRFVQSGDVLYIVHPDYAPRKLTRTGAATFTLSTLVPDGGPFQELDPGETRTVWASANTGNGITLTASSAIFLSAHIGSLFYLQKKSDDTVTQWEPGKSITSGDIRQSNGVYYQAANTATTGTIRPTHRAGSLFDGDAGVKWTYLDPGFGWVKITAIGGGGTTATADVLSRIPNGAVGAGNPTTHWAHGDWSDEQGWPDEITFFRERLCFFRNSLVWQSVIGDFENFRARDELGLVTAEMAIKSDITSDRANRIEWAVPSDVALVCGTAGDEVAMSEISTTDAFAPGNVKARKQSEYGSRRVKPARVGDGIVFAQKAGRKIREMQFTWEKEGYRSMDVTVLAEHVTKGGIIDLDYQQEPDSNVWCVRGDGVLLGLTLNREQDVKGWHPHRIGGYDNAAKTKFAVVESVVAIPSPDGDRDEVWMIVRRNVNGATKRYVEWMEYHHEEGDDPQDAFYLDSGLTLNNVMNATLTPGAGATVKGTPSVIFVAGVATFAAGDVNKYIHYRYSTVDITGKVTWSTAVVLITQFDSNVQVRGTVQFPFPDLSVIAANEWRMTVTTISGLTHLIGQEVQVWADGANHPTRTVTGGGTITLQDPASKVHVGLACPAVLQPMPIEAASAEGAAQGKTGRISRCIIGLHETSAVKYGRDEIEKLDRVELRGGSELMDQAPPLFTGNVVVSWPSGYDGKALITIVADQPGPATVVSLTPIFTLQDNR